MTAMTAIQYRYRTRIDEDLIIVDRQDARMRTWPSDDVNIEQLVVCTVDRREALHVAMDAPNYSWG